MAAPLLPDSSRPHWLALAGLTAGALAYFILARHLPPIDDPETNAFAAAGTGLVLAALMVAFAVPLRGSGLVLGLLFLVGGGTAVLLTAASAPEAAAPFKALFAAAVGFGIGSLIFTPLLVYALALAVALIDIASVTSGPTNYLIEEQPPAVDYLTLFLPHWGESEGTQLGVSDLLFMALYLEAVWRFGLRRRLTLAALTASLVASLAIAVWSDVAVPALPLLSLGLIATNADLVWRAFSRRPAWVDCGAMDLEEHTGVEEVKERCESCGTRLTPAEIELALEGASDAFLCTRCASERVPVEEEAAEEI